MKVQVSNKNYEIKLLDPNSTSGFINNEAFEMDLITLKQNRFHIIKNNCSFIAEVLQANNSEKTFTILVNGEKFELKVTDQYDELLKQLGMDTGASGKINEIKAPMPGMVLDIRVTEGQAVEKGDALIVLEAMKMENIIKSPTSGVIKKLFIKKGIAVEKNQVLIGF